jgi:hypothetical protein
VDELARGAPSNREAVFRTAAAERGLPPLYVEKDFWVCWTLRRLFTPPLINGLVFKGGTSLSKVWRAIKRFSEDIDITLPRTGIPGAEQLAIDGSMSVTQRKKIRKEIDLALAAWCRGPGLVAVRTRIEEALGTNEGWTATPTDDSVEFEYPKGLSQAEYGEGYVKRQVRLEFGAVMPTEPSSPHDIQPYSASAGRYQMADPNIGVQVLEPERTFWEKVTLIHAENHRTTPDGTSRYSRHYADVAELIEHEIGSRAIERIDLLPLVADDKELLFHSAGAHYQDAGQGRLLLVPPHDKEGELRRDYQHMREMYPEEPLSFEEILLRLAKLQDVVQAHEFFRADHKA